MKIIFFLVLAGLSLSHGINSIPKNQPVVWLENALLISPKFLEKSVNFLCNYKEGIENNKKDDLRELMEILESAGCAVDELTSKEDTFEDILEDVGGAGKEVVYNVLKAADELKLTEPVAHLACSQLKGLGTPGGLVDLGGVLGGVIG